MRAVRKKKTDAGGNARTLLTACAVFAVIVTLGVAVFLRLYNSYIDGILYRERLKQMKEVTTQLFSGVEDVIQNQWDSTDAFCNYVELGKPGNTEDLVTFMGKQAGLNGMNEKNERLIAVDDLGRYLTQNGWQGTLEEMDLLLDQPKKLSFVSKSMTSDESYMYFLERLEEPVVMQDGERTVRLIYYGIAQDMERLNPYFSCEAYDNSNSVYVLDNQGMRLFRSSKDGKAGPIQGYNAFSTLEGMQYLHGNSFEEARQELEKTGYGYSNAVLDGREYYYALYRMENAAWTLLFCVPSSYVAMDVVTMVGTTVRLVLVFALILLAATTLVIFVVLRYKQKQAIAAERRNSESLEKMNRELSDAVEAAERAEQAAKDANKAKSDFLANMSHDIRTPMNAIVGITKLMEYEHENPEKMELYIHKVQSSSRHLLSLINDVLDMSKIEASGVSLSREPVNFPDQVEQIDSIIRPQTEDRRQTFTVGVHGITHPDVIGDAVRLRQIFINLLSNAVKYTPVGGKVSLDLTELPGQDAEHMTLAITVTDNGCGMTPEFAEHIFEPFTRAENSLTNKVQGTGLGMAITKSIVDLMGGTISLQSEVGKGSCFHVTLPFPIDPSAKERAGNREAGAENAREGEGLRGMKFLCAEDNALNAEILEAILNMNGASCDIYPDGQKLVEAFAKVRPGDYDAVLMDVQMPVMNGLDATRAIRSGENPLGRTIPIIAMTANAFSSDVQECLASGMNAHVAKPLDLSALERAVKAFAAPHRDRESTGPEPLSNRQSAEP